MGVPAQINEEMECFIGWGERIFFRAAKASVFAPASYSLYNIFPNLKLPACTYYRNI
jgi:hypothetical protein